MLDQLFQLVPGAFRDSVRINNTPVIIGVFDIRHSWFEALDNQMVFYTTGQYQLAFLVCGWEQVEADMISTAIKWYGLTKGYGELEIILRNPKLRLVS